MKKNRFYIFVCFVIGSFLLSSCLKDDDYTPIPVAGLTMVNGYPDDQGIIYYTDQNRAIPLAYKSVVAVNFLTGNRKILVKAGQAQETLVDTTVTIDDSTHYTSFTYGVKDNPLHVLTVDKAMQSPASAESVGLRFFNLADITGKVSLQIGDQDIQPAFKDRAVENQTSATANQGFLSQNSGTFKLTIKDESGNTLVTREDIKLEANRYYSIILTGKKDDDTTPLYIGVVNQG